jgi:colicin import membrane protein
MDKVYMQLLFASNKTVGHVTALASIVLAFAAVPLSVSAQQAVIDTPFNQRYPVESVESIATADAVLLQASKERVLLGDRYIDDQRACFKKFFVSSCLEDAKERNRISIKQVREVEVVANEFKRQSKADDRDKSLSEQRIKDEQDAIRRARDQKDKQASSARKVKDGAIKQHSVSEREAQAAGHADDRVRAHQAKVQSDAAAEAAKAPQRAANEQAYKEKAKAAEAHRRDVAEKKAEKQRDLAAKKQDQEQQKQKQKQKQTSTDSATVPAK